MARHLMAAAVLLMAAGIAGAQAEDYPARTVTIIVPFAAGGPADITGRIVADISITISARSLWWRMREAPVAPLERFAPLVRQPTDIRSCPVTSAPMRWLRRFTPIWATTRRGFRADRTERRIS